MSIHVALHHKTHYAYDRLVSHSPHVVRLRPAPHCRTSILSYSQRVLPKNHFLSSRPEPAALEGDQISHSHGAGRSGSGTHAPTLLWLVPGFRLVARATLPSPWPGRPIRLRLPDPASERRQISRRAFRRGTG